MKKFYSKKLGGEAFALDAAQLDILKQAGYTVPAPAATASPLVNMLRDAIVRAAGNKTTPAADKPEDVTSAAEVVE